VSGEMPGCRRVRVPDSVVAGSVRYGSRRWRAERALGRGRGGGGVRGDRGNRALGVFRVPLAPCSFLVRQVRRGTGGLCRAFSRSLARCVAFVWGGRNGGLGETWNGPWFAGPGCSGFSPVRFRIGPLLSVYSRSRAVVFPTSPSCSMGVRSGTRRRSERARQRRQEGGQRRKLRAQRPHARALRCAEHAGRLCGHCASGWLLWSSAGYLVGSSALERHETMPATVLRIEPLVAFTAIRAFTVISWSVGRMR